MAASPGSGPNSGACHTVWRPVTAPRTRPEGGRAIWRPVRHATVTVAASAAAAPAQLGTWITHRCDTCHGRRVCGRCSGSGEVKQALAIAGAAPRATGRRADRRSRGSAAVDRRSGVVVVVRTDAATRRTGDRHRGQSGSRVRAYTRGLAPVAQPAEAGPLKGSQCGFEPHRGHRRAHPSAAL